MCETGHAPLHVVHVLEAAAGGTLRHVLDIARTLPADRFQQTLVLSPSRGPAGLDAALARLRATHPHVRAILLPMAATLSPWHDAAAAFRLRRLMKKIRPGIVHAHSSKAGGIARIAAARRFPVVYTPHAAALLNPLAPRWRRGLFRGIERLLAPSTAAFVAVSQEEARLAACGLRYPPGRIHLIRNGIAAAPGLAAAAPASGEGPVIAFLGRAAPQKGLDLFLAAAAQLAPAHPGVRFRIITPAAPPMVLPPVLQRRTDLRVAPDETAAWRELGHATILAMPSRWEGMPYTLLDAAALGIPVVATRAGAMGELLADGVTALLVPRENPGALARACERLLADAPLRAALARTAREALAPFTLDAMCASLAALYVAEAGPLPQDAGFSV